MKRAFSAADERFMRRALRLAERGRGTTRPNPTVGAVIVRNGRVVGQGFHERAGGPHAEVAALASVRGDARGTTMYVTLEPCCHTGRTGPCTEAILKARPARVVVGCGDPNPLVDGRGIARLRRAGIRVDTGCLETRGARRHPGVRDLDRQEAPAGHAEGRGHAGRLHRRRAPARAARPGLPDRPRGAAGRARAAGGP